MVKITFVEHDGSTTEVDAEIGQSLMKAATYGEVPGISADCGGNCACGTCRVYVYAAKAREAANKAAAAARKAEREAKEAAKASARQSETDAEGDGPGAAADRAG